MCHQQHLLKTFRDRDGSIKDYVCRAEGVVITHVIVSYNRSIDKGRPRGRFFRQDCEFVHGEQPIIRRYPNLRPSVWSNYKPLPEYECWEYPSGLQVDDTDDYSALCSRCYERHEFDSCWQIHNYVWSIKTCRRCFDSLLHRGCLGTHLRELIISFLEEEVQEER